MPRLPNADASRHTNTRKHWRLAAWLLPLGAACALTLAACGGGGSSGSSSAASGALKATVSLTGSAVDSPIPHAAVTITSGAPLGVTGATTIGTISSDGNGAFTAAVPLPVTNTPVFANATDPGDTALVLTSYLGQASTLAATGKFASSNLPNLDISPITTAALTVYAQVNGGSYASLTPSAYATTLRTYSNDILVIAAAIKAVGDHLCTPSSTITSTSNLAAAIAQAANLTSGNSLTLSAAAAALGGNCATVLSSLPQVLMADRIFGPQLDLGDVVEDGVPSPLVGTWQLQGLVAETGIGANVTASTMTSAPTTAVPADVFVDKSVTIASNGSVTSTDGNVTGSVVGNLVALTVIDGTRTYTLRGKLGVVPSTLVSGGTAFSLQAGGLNTGTNILTRFAAVLAPSGATPVWNGVAVQSSPSTEKGVACAAGQPVRVGGFVAGVGGGTVGECIVPSATGWAMNAPVSISNAFDFDFSNGKRSDDTSATPTLTATTWTETSAAPFILTDTSANFSLSSSAGKLVNGQTYYVMGSQFILFATANTNSVLHVASNPLMSLTEGVQGTVDH